ncbi:hypothetical protein PCE1_002403 [Barthelona sp. PCE]
MSSYVNEGIECLSFRNLKTDYKEPVRRVVDMAEMVFEAMYSLKDSPELWKLKKASHLCKSVLPVLLASLVHTVDEIPLLNHNEPIPTAVWDRGSSEDGEREKYALLLLFMGMPTAEATAAEIRKATTDLRRSCSGVAQNAWDMLFKLVYPLHDRVRKFARGARRKLQATSDFDEAAFEAVLKPLPMSDIMEMREEINATFRGNSGDISRYVEEALMEQDAPTFVVSQGTDPAMAKAFARPFDPEAMERINNFITLLTEQPKPDEPALEELNAVLELIFRYCQTDYYNCESFPGIEAVLDKNKINSNPLFWHQTINNSIRVLGNPENSWKRRQYHASRLKTAVPVAFLHCILDLMAVIGSDKVSEKNRPVMLATISRWIGHRNSDFMKALEKISETDTSAIASCVNEINFLVRHLPNSPKLYVAPPEDFKRKKTRRSRRGRRR